MSIEWEPPKSETTGGYISDNKNTGSVSPAHQGILHLASQPAAKINFAVQTKEPTIYQMVKEWHYKFEVDCPTLPCIPHPNVCHLRANLHYEEAVLEYTKAVEESNITEVVDSLCDSLYVVFGTAIAHGISEELLMECFKEVQRSNMSKLDKNGRPIKNPDTGKVMKSEQWSPPQLREIILKYLPLGYSTTGKI